MTRNGRRMLAVGWVSPNEQLTVKKSKQLMCDNIFQGEPVSDRIFFITLARLYLKGELK